MRLSVYQRMSKGTDGVRVQTLLEAPAGVRAGEELPGTAILIGGSERRLVKTVEFRLIADVLYEKDGRTVKETGVIFRHLLSLDLLVEPGEERRIPFRFPIPAAAPLSLDSSKLWLETLVNDGREAVLGDRDELRVLPHPVVGCFLDALKLLGLRLEEVTLKETSHIRAEFPYVQEFEFKPRLPSALDEIEFYYDAVGKERVDFYVEIERVRGWAGREQAAESDADERHIKLTFTQAELEGPERLAESLTGIILAFLET